MQRRIRSSFVCIKYGMSCTMHVPVTESGRCTDRERVTPFEVTLASWENLLVERVHSCPALILTLACPTSLPQGLGMGLIL